MFRFRIKNGPRNRTRRGASCDRLAMQNPSLILGAALMLLNTSPALASGEWEELQGCRLIENKANDGDSFHVNVSGEERIFRLYFVDAPESEDGGRVASRISEQAETFGITEQESTEIGKKAAAFTRSLLSRPFTVLTRGQNAMGASQLKREYAFVTTADGEDLGEMLVSRGLARSYGEDAATPDSKAGDLRDRYDALEAQARREKVGAWGDGASVPTMALPESSKPSEEIVSPNASISVALSAPIIPGARPLVWFGEITIGTTETEFVRAHPRAKRGEDWSDGTQTLRTYVLNPPESLDADKVAFIFANGRLGQIDHSYSKNRLEQRGGWQKDYEALSALFGHAGIPQSYPLVPKPKHMFGWKSEVTGEAASLEVYPDGSSQVTFCMWEDNSSEGITPDGSPDDASAADNTFNAKKEDHASSPLRLPERVETSITTETEPVSANTVGKPVSFGRKSEVLYQRDKSASARLRLDALEDTVVKVIDYRTGRVAVISWIAKNSPESRLWVGVPEGLYKIVYAQQVQETADGEFYAGYYGKLRDPVEVKYDPPTSVNISIIDTEYPNVASSAKEFGSFRPPR